MVRYKYANGLDANDPEAVKHFSPLTPSSNKPRIFSLEIECGMEGPESYHKSLMRGLLTLIDAQEKYHYLAGINGTRDVRSVLYFLHQLLQDKEYVELQKKINLNEMPANEAAS